MPHLDPPPVPPLLNPSTAIPCANVLKECLPCDDDPIANFTAEGPDSDRFSFIFRAHVTPPLGTIIGDVDRPGFCYSTVSQQDAEDCAREDAEENLVTQPPYHGITIYHNTVQSCTGSCPDGSPFTYTVPAGTVVAFTQLEADQRAFGLACQRARTNKVCILTTALNTGCSGSAYNMTLKGLGGTPFFVSWYQLPYLEECVGEVTIGSQFPYIWWITHGELPDGLTLHSCSGVIDGTPTEIGDFPITLRATDATGAYMEKNFTLRVAEITNDSPLTDGSVGAAYLVNFSTSIGDQEQQTWTVVAGTLPAGLTLSTAGVLSGTPTSNGVSNFTVKVVETGSTGFTCEKPFSLTVAACSIPTPTAFVCPPNVTPKTYSPSDPTAPEFISSINRLYVDGSGGEVDVVDYTQAVPVLESTIPLGGGAGSNRIYMIHEPVSDIVVGVYWSNIVTSQPTIFFIDPVLGIVLSETTLSGYSAGFHCNPLFTKQTRDGHLVVLFMQSFLATQRSQLLLIDPASQTILLTRDIPFPIGGDSYVMSRIAFNCDLNEIVLAYDASGTSIETIQRIDLETLADVALIPLPAAVTVVSGVDYDDATGHLITVEFEAGEFHIRIRDATTGAQLQTIATGETTQIGGPRYNFALASFVAPCQALSVVQYYDTNVLSLTCSVSFAGLLDPIYASIADNGNAYIGDSGGGDNVWQLIQT